MEDLIFVSGCTLVTSWAAAVSMDHTLEANISLASMKLSGGTGFVWSNIRGPIVYHNSVFDPVCFLSYVYLACTDFFFVVWKDTRSTQNSGSLHLHQGLGSKAILVWSSHPIPNWSSTCSTLHLPSHWDTLTLRKLVCVTSSQQLATLNC